MKKVILFSVLAFLASCDIYLIEEPVPWDDRDMFIGDYRVEEYSQTTDRVFVYDITVEKAWNRDKEIRIRNFYGVGLDVYGLVNGERLTIPLQEVDGYEIEGTGKVRGEKLELTFVARDLYERPVFADFVDAEGWLY
ncbi:MAG: hypothetical protein ABFS32_10475 [Bacteroidota bacterium]